MIGKAGNTYSATQLSAAIAVGTIAILMIGIQPILLGELVDAQKVTMEGVGLVAMGEIVALGLGVALGDFLIPGTWLKGVTVAAAIFTVCFDILTTWISGDSVMLVVRMCSGLSEGTLIWGTTGVIVRSGDPGRISGIFFVAQTLAQSLLGVLLANVVIPYKGWQAGFVVLAGLSLLPVGLAFAQPATLAPLMSSSRARFQWTGRTFVPLLVVFLQLGALGSFWAYIEPLGKTAGLDARSAQTLIAGVLAMQVLGGVTASLLVRRLDAGSVLLAVSTALVIVMASLYHLPVGHRLEFGMGCLVFGFFWLFALPFQVALAFGRDGSGRLASLVPAAQLLGSASGPLTGSFFVHGNDATVIPLVSATFAVLAALLLGTMWRRRQTAVI